MGPELALTQQHACVMGAIGSILRRRGARKGHTSDFLYIRPEVHHRPGGTLKGDCREARSTLFSLMSPGADKAVLPSMVSRRRLPNTGFYNPSFLLLLQLSTTAAPYLSRLRRPQVGPFPQEAIAVTVIALVIVFLRGRCVVNLPTIYSLSRTIQKTHGICQCPISTQGDKTSALGDVELAISYRFINTTARI